MTDYLLNLARFVSYNEKKEIYKELKTKGYTVSNDAWSYRRLILNKPIKGKPYIASLIELKESFAQDNLTQTIDRLSKYKIKKIKAKIDRNVPFHEKAITDRYSKKYKFVENGDTIYLEAKTENDKVLVRIGVYIDEKENKVIEKAVEYPDLAIESPFTLGEIGDFLRFTKTFKMKIYILTLNDRDCLESVSNFLKENSFSKGNVTVVKDIDAIKANYNVIGFSMWGKNPISSLVENNNKKILLIFGNERRGLLKSTMEICSKVIKVGSSSEPLRATQAASFALGYIFSKK
jgi:tRNA(Leu) C34 or U34 (ribose-2'-O)-methylase TrmL